MTKLAYNKTLVYILKFGFIYMLGETIVHLSGIRLINLNQFWPQPAVTFLEEFILLWGAACIFLTWLNFRLITHFNQLKHLLPEISIVLLIHAFILLYISRNHLDQMLPTQTATVWIPHYQIWLKFEAFLLFLFFAFIQWGKHKKHLN